jgi:hypothetical protein
MKTEYGRLATAQEMMLYDIIQELKKLNEKPTPAKRKTNTKKEVKNDG